MSSSILQPLPSPNGLQGVSARLGCYHDGAMLIISRLHASSVAGDSFMKLTCKGLGCKCKGACRLQYEYRLRMFALLCCRWVDSRDLAFKARSFIDANLKASLASLV